MEPRLLIAAVPGVRKHFPLHHMDKRNQGQQQLKNNSVEQKKKKREISFQKISRANWELNEPTLYSELSPKKLPENNRHAITN